MSTAVPSWPSSILIMIISIAIVTMSCGDSPSDPNNESFTPLSPGMWWVYESTWVDDNHGEVITRRDCVVVITSKLMNGTQWSVCQRFNNGGLLDTLYWSLRDKSFSCDYDWMIFSKGHHRELGLGGENLALTAGGESCMLPLFSSSKTDVSQRIFGPDSMMVRGRGQYYKDRVLSLSRIVADVEVGQDDVRTINFVDSTTIFVGPSALPYSDRPWSISVAEDRPQDSTLRFRIEGIGQIRYSPKYGPIYWSHTVGRNPPFIREGTRTCVASSTGYRIQGMGRKGAAIQ